MSTGFLWLPGVIPLLLVTGCDRTDKPDQAHFAEVEDVGVGRGKEKPNRLIDSKSPYLLQHAHNPVDWYPWGEEAFAKARDEGKPILLSVGYSTCHWCHVMERESFQNEEVAAFLNEHFVAIKLDREERPDVDAVYMTSFQAMFGEGGGWPLNMFLTPDLKPFFGGTYFPPTDRDGRPGLLNALKQTEKAWRERRDEVVGSADQLVESLNEALAASGRLEAGKEELTMELIKEAVPGFLAEADIENGGWGRSEKFPQPSHLRFLLRVGDGEEREFALMTCRKMIAGGIHDHVGGGFHRYTVDSEWVVPHFEKMLYDQAQLLDVLVDAWLITGDVEFRTAAIGIVDYVSEQLTHEEGAFFSAQDAQSEGKEGKFWCWTKEELREVLSPEQFAVIKVVFGITEKGNFHDHSDPEALEGQNVLCLAKSRGQLTEAEQERLILALETMKTVRRDRIPPRTDDKVLASWNGLMIAALARAGRALGEPRILEMAKRGHEFVRAELWDQDATRLAHRWRDGHVDHSQQAESYLYLLRASRLLYEATLEEDYLVFALDLAEGARQRFYDGENGGFYDAEVRDDLVMRIKASFDSATPTPTSVACMEFAVLAEITGREDLRMVAERSLRSLVPTLETLPTSRAEGLRALDFFVSKPARLAIAGEEGAEELLEAAWSGYQRNFLVVGTKGPVDSFTAGLPPVDGKATAYYCVGQTCRIPETDASRVRDWLQEEPNREDPATDGADSGSGE